MWVLLGLTFLFQALFFFFSSRRRHTRLQGDWSRRVLFRSSAFVSEETTDTNADTIGPPAEAAKPRGTEIAALMTPPRMETMRIEPRRDHRWPRVIRQLLERPPTALAFSIMIAGAYRTNDT